MTKRILALFLLTLLLTGCAAPTAQEKQTVYEASFLTNKIKNSTLAAEMGVTHVTMCNAIAEKAEFRAGNLKVLLDYGVPFEIIRDRMKRLYDEKRIAEKYGNGNAETESESEIEAEFEAETETWD